MARPKPLTIDQVRQEIADGDLDTVSVALTDMQGRLSGKRIDADFFLEEVLHHGTEGCNYLLAVDIDMNTVGGYEMSSWERGYGDLVMAPDLHTLHRIDWHPGTVGLLCDVLGHDGAPVAPSPRQVLRRQLDRLAAAGMQAFVGTELEFILFLDSYEEAWAGAYRDLTPANQYNVDYSMVGTARVEPLLARIRRAMTNAGLIVESVKGECNLGQHEIAFKYADALRTCDNHVIYKSGAKEIAAQAGMALTFMAKYNEREGNSCHIHMSFRGTDGAMVMADDASADGMSALGRSFVAGQIAHARELTLLSAPQINSYKRYVEGSFAPTALKWGRDNRTCAFRLVGHGPSLRLENRLPGGDVNPYLAVAGMVAAGLDGIQQGMSLEDAFTGNAYALDADRVPASMPEALALWEGSTWVRETFGADVQAHYANMARVEIAAYGRTVTDWERFRGFERL
jgi:glutamine synthetase